MDVELARKVLEALEARAPSARTRADVFGDGAALAGLLGAVLRAIPGARALADAGVRKELRAVDASTADALERWFEARLAEEARFRAQIAAMRITVDAREERLSSAMRIYRSPDESKRRAVRAALDPALEALADDPALNHLQTQSAQAPTPSSAPKPPPPAPPARGSILLPSPELIQGLTAGIPLDPTMLAALAATTPGATKTSKAPGASARADAAHASASGARSSAQDDAERRSQYAGVARSSEHELAVHGNEPASAAQSSASDSERDEAVHSPQHHSATQSSASDSGRTPLITPGTDRAPPPVPTPPTLAPALRDLARALAESVTSTSPTTFGAWRAAAAATTVADFRPAPTLSTLTALTGATALPFEQPLTPLARPSAATELHGDAASTIAHLLGATAPSGDRALGTALALTAATPIFTRRALAESPRDTPRAARALALATLLRYLAATLAARAAGDPEALRDHTQDLLGAAPPRALAHLWATEHALDRLPGESRALYAHTPTLERELLRGLTLAATLRDRFDEDWFRNPRLTPELLDAHAASSTPATEATLLAWLRDAARL